MINAQRPRKLGRIGANLEAAAGGRGVNCTDSPIDSINCWPRVISKRKKNK